MLAEQDDDREARRQAWIFVGSIAAACGMTIASLIIAACR